MTGFELYVLHGVEDGENVTGPSGIPGGGVFANSRPREGVGRSMSLDIPEACASRRRLIVRRERRALQHGRLLRKQIGLGRLTSH